MTFDKNKGTTEVSCSYCGNSHRPDHICDEMFRAYGMPVRQPEEETEGGNVNAKVRECRGHYHVEIGGCDLRLEGDPFPTREKAEAAAALLNEDATDSAAFSATPRERWAAMDALLDAQEAVDVEYHAMLSEVRTLRSEVVRMRVLLEEAANMIAWNQKRDLPALADRIREVLECSLTQQEQEQAS